MVSTPICALNICANLLLVPVRQLNGFLQNVAGLLCYPVARCPFLWGLLLVSTTILARSICANLILVPVDSSNSLRNVVCLLFCLTVARRTFR